MLQSLGHLCDPLQDSLWSVIPNPALQECPSSAQCRGRVTCLSLLAMLLNKVQGAAGPLCCKGTLLAPVQLVHQHPQVWLCFPAVCPSDGTGGAKVQSLHFPWLSCFQNILLINTVCCLSTYSFWKSVYGNIKNNK